MSQPYKICPQCQTPAALAAPSCSRCGRQYHTQFTPAPQTQMSPPSPSSRTVIQMPPGTHSSTTALLLGFLPGFGQIYNLQHVKGGLILAYVLFCAVGWLPLTLIIAVLKIRVLILFIPALWMFLLITGPIVYFIQFFDAIMIASKLNRGEAVRRFEWF